MHPSNPLARNGFSLIAIALILIVVGASIIILLLPTSGKQFDQVATTQKKLDAIRLALGTYYTTHTNLYPCPASVVDKTNLITFGQQVSTNCQASSGATNACSAFANSGTNFFCPSTNNSAAPPAYSQTWVGMVPVRTLGLADDYAFDAWGNRFMYAVNNTNTFNVNDISGNHNPVNMFAFSAGGDGIGSYNRAGAANKACSTLTASTTSEYENCDYSGTGSDDTFLFTTWNTTPGTSYYDDITFRY